MITYEDCLALADLAPETVDHVAARAGLTPIAAVGLADRLAATAEVGEAEAGPSPPPVPRWWPIQRRSAPGWPRRGRGPAGWRPDRSRTFDRTKGRGDTVHGVAFHSYDEPPFGSTADARGGSRLASLG